MKKKENIYCFLTILTIILILTSISIIKVYKKNKPIEVFSSTTSLFKRRYYKEEYQERYETYKEKNPSLEDDKIIIYVNIGLDRPFYTNTQKSPRQNTKEVLVNKYYYLDKDYVPKDLTLIDEKYQSGNRKMVKEAALKFNEMARSAKESGYNIRAISTYRSFDYQNNLYTRYSQIDGSKKADTYSARPGYSEHQTGLAVDVDNFITNYTNFGSTNEFGWMKNNAYKFGFILRYTKENEFITGYLNEPWHYRYVGVGIATKMKQENISSYEEFYFKYLD